MALLPAVRAMRLLIEPVPPGHHDLIVESGVRSRELDDDSAEVSFRRFVAARWNALQRYAFVLTGDHQFAEDVVQVALEKCWRRWDRIRADSPEAYVRAAVANTAASRRRRTLTETSLDDILVQPVAQHDHAEAHALRSGLWSALFDLPPRQRTIIALRLWEDRSVEETARVLGITQGAVKSQLSKGLAQLRRHPQVRDVLAGTGIGRTEAAR
ncbi:SigE family RNA polymerase sigma factor [Kineosporia sp. J2-2]|uniref:SigE family RNA polymerase sigma factor n=1 Tax=Kineosporia corallincola TaxID=2835133 RepID=A0ABS5TF77_9ACTN|nr:SigE family RNA polymerase sigma factor [Kineosporia corallincola]MBT0769744.1 SigE family RNA polymerase sigma factor [Kineosporia corallincola]